MDLRVGGEGGAAVVAGRLLFKIIVLCQIEISFFCSFAWSAQQAKLLAKAIPLDSGQRVTFGGKEKKLMKV